MAFRKSTTQNAREYRVCIVRLKIWRIKRCRFYTVESYNLEIVRIVDADGERASQRISLKNLKDLKMATYSMVILDGH